MRYLSTSRCQQSIKSLLINVSEEVRTLSGASQLQLYIETTRVMTVLPAVFFLKPIHPPAYKSDLKPAIYDGFLS